MTQGQGAAARLQQPSVAHAHAGLGADQVNFACVHAAQCCHVKRITWRACCACQRGGLCGGVGAHTGCGNVVGTRDHLQLLRPNARVDLQCAAQNGGVVCAAGIQALPFDGNLPALDPEAFQRPGVHDRGAGGQNGRCDIDEAAAIDGNA